MSGIAYLVAPVSSALVHFLTIIHDASKRWVVGLSLTNKDISNPGSKDPGIK